jgi:DNA polymerase elongation subunit (family B)
MGRIEGWIFDTYPESEGMRVWVIDRRSKHWNFLDPWRPFFYLTGSQKVIAQSISLLQKKPFPVQISPVERTEFFSGKTVHALEIRIPPLQYNSTVAQLKDTGPILYNADIHLAQAYHYERGHFPLARGTFEITDGRLTGWSLEDDPWALDYELPPLKYVHLFLTGSDVAGRVDPNHAQRGNLAFQWENSVYEFEGPLDEQLLSLQRRLDEWDPDVITSDWGDSFLLPKLHLASVREKANLRFSRDKAKDMAGRGSRSFFTYGRTVYQSGCKYLFGRWHLDNQNSFFLKECGLDGLFEIARVAKIPVQRAARTTIGTSLSSMQLDHAYKLGYLVPMEKQQVEDFRPSSDLVIADKGGLVYEPKIGWYEQVVEYDFVSMYPQLMVQNNISPETVNCSCCRHNRVPEIGHNLCQRRKGLVPAVLDPILRKRTEYKRRAKTNHPSKAAYKNRASAFKWALVYSFGYLGFRNARFGKIEAHECVTAWGRRFYCVQKIQSRSEGFRFSMPLWIHSGSK